MNRRHQLNSCESSYAKTKRKVIMTATTGQVLLIGFGNPGRQDDGLGPAMAQAIEQKQLPGVTVDSDYQLTVEDAAEVAKYDTVVFADASVNGAEPFWVKRIHAVESGVEFSTHSIDARSVLALAKRLFGAQPKAYLLGIRGYDYNEFGEVLSPRAKANLVQAIDYFVDAVKRKTIEPIRHNHGDESCKTENT
jgi:hydrogenase maturation protease